MMEVKEYISLEFPLINNLKWEEIAPHECEECFKVRDDFYKQTWDKIDTETLEYHYDSLPLFSPKAFNYYIPAYMVSKLENINSSATDMLEYSLCPSDEESKSFILKRKKEFTKGQKEVMVKFLLYCKSKNPFDQKEYERGIEIWEK